MLLVSAARSRSKNFPVFSDMSRSELLILELDVQIIVKLSALLIRVIRLTISIKPDYIIKYLFAESAGVR